MRRGRVLRWSVLLAEILEGVSIAPDTFMGDTNGNCSAAIYGLRNKSDISIFILHPKGRVSPIQEAQMTTVTDPNVHNLAVKGTFDDCQVRISSITIY